ncbi:MAG: ferredoxin [Candidatus Woesearchaeota archaeon]
MKYKIKYHKDKCIGAGSCAKIAPKTWKLGSDGLAILLKSSFTDAEKAINVKAAKSCPAQAIEIFDEKGKKIV